MRSILGAARPLAARTFVVLIVASIVGACAGAGDAAPSTSVPPSAAAIPSPSPSPQATPVPSPRATPLPSPAAPFPIAAFADISLDPVPEALAAGFQAALVDMAGRGGMAATVMTDDGTWNGATGSSDGAHDLLVDSQFGIASVTKSIIAAQVMQLVEAGDLTLDDPVTDHLPADLDFDTNGATIRDLLAMRAGIPDWYGDAMERDVATDRSRVWSSADVLALVGSNRTPAGASFMYTDTNYNLVGLVIEHVRKRPLVQVLRDGVLRVEGTERLIYQPDEAPTDPMAMPRGEPQTALEQGGGYLPSLADASSAGPAGSIASDPLSLARWWRAFCAGEIVSQASLTEMSNYFDGPDGYGLGLFNPADPWAAGVGHLGSNFGYVSWAGCLPEDHAIVVVLTNQAVDDIGGLAEPLVRAARED